MAFPVITLPYERWGMAGHRQTSLLVYMIVTKSRVSDYGPAINRLSQIQSLMYICNIYIPLCRALRVLVHEGNLVNGRGRDNARAEGECIIRPRPLTRLPECTKARNARQSGI